ncbi:hypothetical protein RGQ29_016048 [Quercus rubra]|uniref:Uncharacterized protein n=1 Tax=Quercus rubra TaxID=3512 RepID=A0AAN7J585_QUERU|nr:hypothetical protein RGQ29_016048 [Quercus rubra]
MKQQFCPKEQFSLVQELQGSQIERILVVTVRQIRHLLEVQ